MTFQLLEFEPALVVSMGGINDFSDAGVISRAAQDGALGMPAHYALLAEVAVGRRWPTYQSGPWSLWPLIMPSTARRLGMQDWEAAPAAARSDPQVLNAAVRRYLTNLRRMADLTHAAGGRFIAAGQPVASLHAHLSRPDVYSSDPEIEAFHAAVTAAPKPFEWHDLSRVFDDELPVVPVRVDELADDLVFYDEVHLRGRGNAIVAARIAAWLDQSERRETPPGLAWP